MTAFSLHFAIIALCLVFVNSAPTGTPDSEGPSPSPAPDANTEVPEVTVQITDAPPQPVNTGNPGGVSSPPTPSASPKVVETPSASPPPQATSGAPAGNPTSAPQKETAPPEKSGTSALSMSLTLGVFGLLLCRM